MVRPTANAIPISARNNSTDVPPAEINGRDTPVFGTELVTTAIFNNTCTDIWQRIPIISIALNKSLVFPAMIKRR